MDTSNGSEYKRFSIIICVQATCDNMMCVFGAKYPPLPKQSVKPNHCTLCGRIGDTTYHRLSVLARVCAYPQVPTPMAA